MKYKRYSFERLKVWQVSKELTKAIYQITKDFPPEERFGLISQMRRAAISICSNIAEGTARRTKKDQAHFSTQAYSSLMELLNQIILSEELGFLESEGYKGLRTQVHEVAILLSKLRQAQLRD
jgi:four helix bundle protein